MTANSYWHRDNEEDTVSKFLYTNPRGKHSYEFQ